MFFIKTWTRIGLVSAILFFGKISSVSANVFPDVPPEHPAAAAVAFSFEKNWISGYPDGTFRPNETINRAEMIKILVQKNNTTSVGAACFSDIADEWFAAPVCTARQLNWVSGYPDGTFRPAQHVNFAKAAKMVVNSQAIPTTDDDNTWYKKFVQSLRQRDAVPESLVAPEQLVTRGEFVQILYRLDTETNPPSHTENPVAQGLESANPPNSDIELPSEMIDQLVPAINTTETTIEIAGQQYTLQLRPTFDRIELERVPGTARYRVRIPE